MCGTVCGLHLGSPDNDSPADRDFRGAAVSSGGVQGGVQCQTWRCPVAVSSVRRCPGRCPVSDFVLGFETRNRGGVQCPVSSVRLCSWFRNQKQRRCPVSDFVLGFETRNREGTDGATQLLRSGRGYPASGTRRRCPVSDFVFTHVHLGFHKKRAAPVCMILVISLEARPRAGAIKAAKATQATDLMVFPAISTPFGSILQPSG